jgi:hypothetical protein
VNDLGVATDTVVRSGGGETMDAGGEASGTALDPGGSIDVTYLSYATGGSAGVTSSGVLMVSVGGQSYTQQLSETYPGEHFDLAPGANGGTGIIAEAACFRRGTAILTDRGEMLVEALRVGDRVALAFGGTAPVTWLGHRCVDCRRHPKPCEVWPVRVAAGAFAPEVPHRDLWLSPDHAVFVDGVLIPVRHLINGASIAQQAVAEVTYWHVELPGHAVMIAEGLPAESYLDTGNRAAFANGGAAVLAHPDFALRVWETAACAKLMADGPAVVSVRKRLRRRAMRLGWTATDAPAPLLVADGQEVGPHESGDGLVMFRLPPGRRQARLLSRATIAAHGEPHSTDYRRLGLAVTALALDGVELPLDSARLGTGWHAPEPGLRWTDGAASLALAGARGLTVRFAALLRYWTDTHPARTWRNHCTPRSL